MDKRLLYWYCQWQNFWFYHLNFQFAKYQPTNLQVLPLVTYNLQLIYQKRGPTNLQLFHFQSCRFYNPKQPNSYRICHPPHNCWCEKRFGSKKCGSKKFLTWKRWSKEWSLSTCTFLLDHCVSWSYGSHRILLIWVTLVLVNVDHSVSCGYGSPCILWLLITLYPLTLDHPVYVVVI